MKSKIRFISKFANKKRMFYMKVKYKIINENIILYISRSFDFKNMLFNDETL